jgi:hypothetical protein
MIVIKNIISLIKEISKLKISHYANEYMDPLRTGGESLWIHGAGFGNHCLVTAVNFKNISIL